MDKERATYANDEDASHASSAAKQNMIDSQPTQDTQGELEQLRQQAQEYIQAKQWSLASQILKKLLDHNVHDEDTLRSAVLVFDVMGHYEFVLTLAETLLDRETNAAYALAYKARALQKLDRLSEATIANDQALLLDTNLPLAWINRSGLQLLQQKFPEALRNAQRAVELAPDDARAWANLGIALLNFNSLLDALEAFNKSIACDPTNLFSLKLKSETLFKLGRLDEVVTITRQTLDIDPINVDALTHATRALRSLERYDLLQVTAKELTVLEPKNHFAWENYMRGLRGSGNFEAANDVLDHLLELDPSNFRFWTIKADTLYRLQHYREAVSIADRAIFINQDYPPARRIRERALKLMYQRKKV